MDSLLKVNCINKRYKDFQLKDICFEIPKGYNIALVGTNGAGKTTLIDILMGFIKADNVDITYFEKEKIVDEGEVKNKIGYVCDGNYFLDYWKAEQVAKAMSLGYDNFNKDKFYSYLNKFEIDKNKTVISMSKGTKMRIMLASQLARDTKLLILDEPASPLDPLMRDELCDIFREYIKDGESSILFSTHNISDMENVTDYIIIMEKGRIIEKGFVEDLKEKYFIVRGDSTDISDIRPFLLDVRLNGFGFEGITLCENIHKLNEFENIIYEKPNLQQIVIMLLKEAKNSD
jgi:ABC-2 type transport system ATP-binding protein